MVKFFRDVEQSILEKEINDWLKTNKIKNVIINYQVCGTLNGIWHYVLINYDV